MPKPDPLYQELKLYPETDATVFLLRAVALEETGDVAGASRAAEAVNDVMASLDPNKPEQVFVFADGFDRALGILKATGRNRWVERYGVFAESLGNVMRVIFENNPQVPTTIREDYERMAPMSGIAHFGGEEYRIFDGVNRRSDAQLLAILQPKVTATLRNDPEVARLAEGLPSGHPVSRLLGESGATAATDRWVKPFLLLRSGDKPSATAAQKSAVEQLLVQGREALTNPSMDSQSRVDFVADLISVEEVAQALLIASRTISGRERSIAHDALWHIGAVVTAVNQVLPPVFGKDITSIWNDGSVAIDNERVRIPGADLAAGDLREAVLWLTGKDAEIPGILTFDRGDSPEPDLG
jgi:hypothetical protein